MEKWYVIQVRGKMEEKIKKACEQRISSDVLKECFVPKHKQLKKINGKWSEVESILFSGYVFLVSDNPNELYLKLKEIPDLTKMLGYSDNEFYPLYDEEVEFLKTFTNQEYIVEMSKGLIENDEIKITSGPLKGKEGIIRKINRHKRIAMIEVELFGKITQTYVGLEIISKT